MFKAKREYWDDKYKKDNYAWGLSPSYVALKMEPRIKSGMRVLDIACGCGRDALFYAKKGAYSTGIDWSEEGIRQANKLCQKDTFNGRLEFKTSDFCEIEKVAPPFSFDIISCYNAFHLLRENSRQNVFFECLNLLKKGGIFSFTVFSTKEKNYGEGEELEKHSFMRKGQLVHYFTDNEIRDLTKGFKTVFLEHVECFEDYPKDHFHQEWFYAGRRD